jgi:hypothetical protein
MQDDWLFHTSRARELRERDRAERESVERAKLPPKPRLLVAELMDLFPHTRGDPGPLEEKVIAEMIKAKLKAEHSTTKFGRTSLRKALDYVWYGRLPRRPARTNTNKLRTNNQ